MTDANQDKVMICPDVSKYWRSARVDELARGFGDNVWFQTNNITIKPNVSIKSLEKQLSEERGVAVKLVVPKMDWEEVIEDVEGEDPNWYKSGLPPGPLT